MRLGGCASLAFSDNEREPFVALLAKRTYDLAPDGSTRPASQQEELCGRVLHERRGQGGKRPLRHDDDRMCIVKRGTDLIVQGSAHSRHGAVQHMTIRVSVARGGEIQSTDLVVTGNRNVHVLATGLAFSEPEPFVTMPVSYDRAFGGHDFWSEDRAPDPALDEMAKYLPVERNQLHRYLYPRNPAGCGYLVHRHDRALEQVRLPNIEYAAHPLHPQNLIVGDPHRWHRAPPAAGLDWRDQFWYPRCALLGFTPRADLESGESLHEVVTAQLPPELARGDLRHILEQRFIDRFAHGASAGLAFDTWSGDERILVRGMHPDVDEMMVAVPRERPRMRVELPVGGTTALEAKLRTVVIRPDEGTLVLVWAGRCSYRGLIGEGLAESVQFGVDWR